MENTIETLNPMDDGTCRTLKNQYAQTSAPNLASQGTFGASGAIEVKRILAIDEQNMLVRSETIGTLTTDGNSPKHNNRVAECQQIKIRQATEQGYALCEIGGGSGLGISDKPNKARKSNRERKDLPYSDNGEYP